jgi:hypothetical protein
MLSSPELLTITWLLDHSSVKIQTEAKRLMEGLRVGASPATTAPLPPTRIGRDGAVIASATASGAVGGAAAGATDVAAVPSISADDAFVVAMLERGCVPVLQGLTGSANASTVDFADRVACRRHIHCWRYVIAWLFMHSRVMDWTVHVPVTSCFAG